jgi:Zn-dependent protease
MRSIELMGEPTDPATTPADAPPRRARRPGTVQVARILGVPIYLTFSWMLLAGLVTLGYGGVVGGHRSPLENYLLGAGVVVCLLVSVLLHELGHAVVARRYGVGVRGITLELLGGFTEMDRDAPRPGPEAAIALAGPAVSFALALTAAALIPITPRGTVIGDLAFQLAFSNAIVAAFNVLPGLPLDGGRALRAGIWRITRDPQRADRIAGWAGRGIALATLGATVLLYAHARFLTVIGLLFMLMVALTLWNGASEAIQMAEVKRRLPQLQAGRMARPLFLVPHGTPLAEALRRRDESAANQPVIGIEDAAGRVVALVSGPAVAAVPLERRPWVDVDSVASTVAAGQRIPASSNGTAMLAAVQANPGSDLLVTVGEDVIGVLRVVDVISALQSGSDA